MKEWFEKNVSDNSKSRIDSKTFEKEINWDKSLVKKAGEEDYIIVPICYKNKITTGEKVKGLYEYYDLSIYSSSYLLLKNGKEKKALLINYIADKEYFRENDFTIDGDFFSGKMYIKTWNEEFLYGYVIEKGKIKSNIFPEGEPANKNARLSGCTTISIAYWSVACTPGYGCGEPQYMYTSYTSVCDYGTEYNPDAINWSLVPFGGQTYNPSATLNTPEAQAYIGGLANENEKHYYQTHPWLIPPAIVNKYSANSIQIGFFNLDIDGCNGNAFKHAMWSGLNTLTWDSGTARFMGSIHESHIPNYDLSKQMDLYNNELGISIAESIKAQVQDPKDQVIELKWAILDAIELNHAGKIIKNGQLVPSNALGAQYCQ